MRSGFSSGSIAARATPHRPRVRASGCGSPAPAAPRCAPTSRPPRLRRMRIPMSDAPTVLIIDDEPQIRRFLRAGFDLEHFTVIEAETGEAGLRAATLRQPDLIVLDLNLPDLDGAD